MPTEFRFLLLQVRDPNDPMRQQEVGCFARAFDCREDQIEVFNLIQRAPTADDLRPFDIVLLGGSGDYSVAEGGPWLDAALFAMRELYHLEMPTFASCWGFQAMALALGGKVVTDPSRAELGTLTIGITAAGLVDPLFTGLGTEFAAQMGHQDIVDQLPTGACLLASTEKVQNQAFCFPGKLIYCTQFHPELDRQGLVTRLQTYPKYVERIANLSVAEFVAEHCQETPEANSLLPRFLELVARQTRR